MLNRNYSTECMKCHCMVDLETLSTEANAQIIAIGAVKFTNTDIVQEFYRTIELEDNKNFHYQASTVAFWLRQAKVVQDALFFNPKPLKEVLREFTNFYIGDDFESQTYNHKHGSIISTKYCTTLWGNGVDFDNVILRKAYELSDLREIIPWTYRDNRCFRTIKNFYQEVPLAKVGDLHNALADTKTQALHLIKLGILK